MALLDLESELARARDGAAFHGNAAADRWQNLWCFDCQVDEDQCPLLEVALLGRTPAAWTLRDPAGFNRYTCTEYRETVEEQ